MNKNIEVINKHLWAVRFTLIPFIPEIDYKPDNTIPAYEEWGRLANNGLLILNKDHANYQYVKSGIQKLMKKTKKQLKRDLQGIQKIKSRSALHEIHYYMYLCELERREKVKKSKRWR